MSGIKRLSGNPLPYLKLQILIIIVLINSAVLLYSKHCRRVQYSITGIQLFSLVLLLVVFKGIDCVPK